MLQVKQGNSYQEATSMKLVLQWKQSIDSEAGNGGNGLLIELHRMLLICGSKRKSKRDRGSLKLIWGEINELEKVGLLLWLADCKEVKVQGKVQVARGMETLRNRALENNSTVWDKHRKRVNRDLGRIRNGVAEEGHRPVLAERP